MLEQAIDAFATGGYEAVSMNEIARRSGVTKPMVYSYFGSKEELYAACISRTAEHMVTRVREAVDPEAPPDQQLWAGIVAQLRFIDEFPGRWRVFLREAMARAGGPGLAALLEGSRQVSEMLADLFERVLESQGMGSPPRRETLAQAHALQGAVDYVTSWWESNPEEPLEAVALRIMNFAWQGFGNLFQGRVWIPPPGSAGR